MRNILTNECTKEKPNSSALGAFNQSISTGGNYRLDNQFGSFTSIKIIPQKDNYFVQTKVRLKNTDGTERIQIKERVLEKSKISEFKKDLINRGGKKLK